MLISATALWHHSKSPKEAEASGDKLLDTRMQQKDCIIFAQWENQLCCGGGPVKALRVSKSWPTAVLRESTVSTCM